MDTINPNLLYELGTLREVLAGAFDALQKGTKQAKTPDAVTCKHLRHCNEVWVMGSDVIDWLSTTRALPADGEIPATGEVQAAKFTPAPAPAPVLEEAAPAPAPVRAELHQAPVKSKH